MKTIEELQRKIGDCEKDVNELFHTAITSSFLNDASMLRERLDIYSSDLQLLMQQAPKTDAMVTVESLIKSLMHRLESLTTANMLCRDNAKVLYQEAGQWARHFSTVRMTVATFTITSCTAIIALASKKDGLANAADVITPVSVLWILGLSVFWIFTVETYRHLYYQRKGLPTFLMRPLKGKATHLPFDWASLVIAGLCLAALLRLYPETDPKFYFAKISLVVTTVIGFLFLLFFRALARH